MEKFIEEDDRIDYSALRNFTKKLTLNKQHEYYDDLFKDNTINYSLLDRNNSEKRDSDEFIEKHSNSKFVKDCLEFIKKSKEYKMGEISFLENCLYNLRRDIQMDKKYYIQTLDIAINRNELMKELKSFCEANKCIEKKAVEVSV